MRLHKFFLFALVFSTLVHAQNYLWPTDASTLMTSSFCEFRPRHYHAAIDIKTWQQTGYKIFAIDDGYVYRIRVASTGYGKAIYLKLKDGNFVVYGHLEGFNSRLDAYTDSLRLAARNNVLDVYPKAHQFPVKKGDHLGFTGATGIGVPHLHFEIRDQHQRPINPLQFYKDIIQDNISPLARYLAVIPAGGASFINFQPDTLILAVSQNARVKMDKPIYLSGKAYLALRTYDLSDGIDNRFGLYGAEMAINDSLVYKVKYDRFSYDETRLIEIDKNFSLWRKGLRAYHNFYRHPANSLPFYGDTPRGGGLLSGKSLREGKNTVVLKVYDYFGNTLEIEIPVIYHRILLIHANNLQTTGEGYGLEIKSPEPLNNFQVQRVSFNPSREEPVRLANVEFEEDLLSSYFYYRLTIPNQPARGGDAYQIRASYSDGLPTLPFYIFPNEPNGRSTANSHELTFYGKWVTVKGRGYPANSTGLKSASVYFLQYKPDAYLLSFPYGSSDILRTPLGPDMDLQLTKELAEWTPIYPGKERTVRSDDGVLSLHFPSNAVYDTIYTHIKRFPARQNLKAPYRYAADIYDVQPFDQPMDYGANITFTLPDSIASQNGVGLYYFDRKKGWLYLPSRQDARGNFFYARVTSLEKFTAIRDTIPPEIIALNLSYSSSPLKFRVKDEMAGIYNETQISVEINGRWSLFEFDPEEDLVIIPSRYLPKDADALKITATDNAGNNVVNEFRINRNGNGDK